MQLSKRKKIVVIFIVYLIVMLILYIYCLPDSVDMLGTVLLKSIIASLFGFALISQIKLTKWTGGLEYSVFRTASQLLPFVFSVPMVLFTIYAIIRLLANKHFENTFMILPTISIVYNSLRIYQINNEYKSNTDKIN